MTIISGFGQTPHFIMLTDKLKDSERRLWGYFNQCQMQKDYSYPKPETIAGDLNLNKKVIERGIRALVGHGLLAVEKDANGKAIYRLLDIPTSFSGLAEAIKLPVHERQERQAAKQQEREERQEQRPAEAWKSHPAIKVFKEVTRYHPSPDVEGLRAAITTIGKYDLWRRFLEECIGRGYGAAKLQNVEIVNEYKAWVNKKREAREAEERRAQRRREEAAEWIAGWDEPKERVKQQDAPPREEAKPQGRAILSLKSETPDSAKSGASTASQSG